MGKNEHARVTLAYDRKAYRYDTQFHLYSKAVLPPVVEMLALTGNEHILDVACGTGELEVRLAEKFPDLNVCGIDLSEEMLASASRKLARCAHMEFEQGDARYLGYPDATFDIVVCCSAFHYMREPVRVMHEFRRVLKPGGRVLIHDWCRDFLMAKLYNIVRRAFIPSHYHVYTKAEMHTLMQQAGLTPTRTNTFTALGFWRMMVAEAVKTP